ncbi:MAG: DUF481 domain-containing protein [Acidobacteriota bacterium]|nr:DUF481 domain-containing protein [Acidobacteriota bacterium]
MESEELGMGRVILLGCIATVLGGSIATAQVGNDTENTVGWANETELSLATTEGNSNTDSLAFKNSLTRSWKHSRLKLLFDGMRTNNADDRFLLIDPGQVFLPGEQPNLVATEVISPSKDPDAEKYFFEGRFTRKMLSGTRSWNTGGSWDRNEDAGILNRYIAFGGIGNHWIDGPKLNLETSYGLSYTDREEEEPDPEKEQEFLGFRLTADFDYLVRPTTTLSYDFTGNINFEDRSDYSIDTAASVSVAMSGRISLKASIQLLNNSEPALEDVDVIALLRLNDPDGTPGSGDEFFETVAGAGPDVFELTVSEGQARKSSHDTVVRTSLVIRF